MNRASGILLHPTSLPSNFGCGTFGKSAYSFVDLLEKSNQKIWQMLPLGPTDSTASPYQSYSAFAGNPILIDLEMLCEDGLLDSNNLKSETVFDNSLFDYKIAFEFSHLNLKKAFENFVADESAKKFYKQNSFWLDDYAFFMALNDYFGGIYFVDWPKKIKLRDEASSKSYRIQLQKEIDFHKFTQFKFFEQYFKLKDYANSKNIKIIGDIPIYVSANSADVWANKELFELNASMKPKNVAGVPPDYFSQTGQRWGNPIYKWKNHKINNFAWWVSRMKFNLELFDVVRIDHFRGFEAFWSIPARENTAINGKWVKGPNHELFQAFEEKFGKNLPIIAEDLGVITPEVEKLRDDFSLPGMKILQFAFGSGAQNGYLSHNYVQNCIVYTGTHDNDTTVGWINELKDNNHWTLNHLCEYLDEYDLENLNFKIIAECLKSVARFAIIPMQDILELDTKSRMNIPGTVCGNWQYKMNYDDFESKNFVKLKNLSEIYGR